MIDRFAVSRDLRGARVNIKASIDRARSSVGTGARTSCDMAAKLNSLLDQLCAQLQAVGLEHRVAAQALAASTAVVVEAAAAKSSPAKIPKKILECGKTLLKTSPVIATTVKNILDMVEQGATLVDT